MQNIIKILLQVKFVLTFFYNKNILKIKKNMLKHLKRDKNEKHKNVFHMHAIYSMNGFVILSPCNRAFMLPRTSKLID